jgi:Asp-tRNA(Asn)/Glu-tRNA(Gln) amidotransferase A subunit family amidase
VKDEVVTNDVSELSLAGAVAALATGHLTAERFAAGCLARIAEREPTTAAWEYLDPGAALEQAREIDRRGRPGPLHGAAIAVKDIIDTAGLPTRYGSPIYTGHRPPADAWCVSRLREAGALILGKTVTTEFAYFAPGKTVNPVDPGRTPGGSSSGSAAAVADHMVPAALGTQTAGSTARPAAFCGIAGYVPTHGRVPLTGVRHLSPGLDTLGYLARNVTDLALLDAVVRRVDPPSRLAGGPLHVLIWRGLELSELEPEMAAALARAEADLGAAGATVSPFPLASVIPELVDAQVTVMAYEAARVFDREQEQRDQLSVQLLQLIDRGTAIGEAAYREALRIAGEQRQRIGALLGAETVIVAPAACGPAPLGLASTGSPTFSRPWQLLGAPSVTIPGYRTDAGLPLGIQAIGAPGADPHLLRAAQRIEQIIQAAAATA